MADQSIANRFTAQQRGSLQAARNANDGISLSQTTQGYLDEINPRLQHVRELTIQGLNGSYTPEDKDQTQTEIHRIQLQDDITHNQSDIGMSYQYHER